MNIISLGMKVNGRGGSTGNAAEFHYGDAWFESGPTHRLSLLRLLSRLSQPFQKHARAVPRLDEGHFLKNSL
jgi:hypothetical protein